MTDPKEIYCYADPTFTGDLDVVLSLLRGEGHRVLVGADASELSLLLELSHPSAIIFTLPTEGSTLSMGFQEVASRALATDTPLILVGPGDPVGGLRLYTPRQDTFEESSVPLHTLPGLVDELVDGAARDEDQDHPDKMVDTAGDDSEMVRVETEIVRGVETRIITTVSRGGQVVIREEQTIDTDDADLRLRLELQHRTALRSYQPADQSAVPAGKLGSEVSGPITLPPASPRPSLVGGPPPRRLRGVVALLVGAALISAAAALYLSTLPTTPLPRPSSDNAAGE